MGEEQTFSLQPSHPAFNEAGNQARLDYKKVMSNIGILLDGLNEYQTVEEINHPDADIDVQRKFLHFLHGCEFYAAIPHFETTLKESKEKPRNDGTTAWHHQLSQVCLFLDQVRRGTITIEQLENYGGLEVCVATILRHDSIEDFGLDFEHFAEEEAGNLRFQFGELTTLDIKGINEDWFKKQQVGNKFIERGLRLITKKIALLDENRQPQYASNGKMIRQNIFDNDTAYTQNLVRSDTAMPTIFVFKLHDSGHNLSNMLGAPKFTADKRRDYCNRRENMFGPRQGLTNAAIRRWPEFEESLLEADNLMGLVLYINLGFLDIVDRDQLADKEHQSALYPLGMDEYLERALRYNIPRALNPIHILLDQIQHVASHDPDRIRRQRTEQFIEKALKPVLVEHKEHFPNFFPPPQKRRLANDNKPKDL